MKENITPFFAGAIIMAVVVYSLSDFRDWFALSLVVVLAVVYAFLLFIEKF